MKVLFLASDSCWGGANVALYNLIQFALENGVQPFVLVPKKKGPLCDRLNDLKVPFRYLGYTLSIYPSKDNVWYIWLLKLFYYMVKNALAKLKFRKIIDEVNPSVVHTNVGPLSIAQKICIRKGIPHVWHIREYADRIGLHFFPSDKIFRKMMRMEGNYNVAITRGVFNHYGLRKGLDQVVYDGVFDAKSLDLGKKNKEKMFLFVGRLERNKQAHVAINGFVEFQKKYKDYVLMVVGADDVDPVYTKECIRLIKENGAEKNIHMCGMRNDVGDLMKKSVGVIVPSLFEGFGFVTAEAMLNRCVVIGRNTTGTKEQFDNGLELCGREIGIRFDSDDEVAGCLVRTVRDDLEEMIENAQKTAVKFYTAQKSSEAITLFYQHVMSLQGKK